MKPTEIALAKVFKKIFSLFLILLFIFSLLNHLFLTIHCVFLFVFLGRTTKINLKLRRTLILLVEEKKQKKEKKKFLFNYLLSFLNIYIFFQVFYCVFFSFINFNCLLLLPTYIPASNSTTVVSSTSTTTITITTTFSTNT